MSGSLAEIIRMRREEWEQACSPRVRPLIREFLGKYVSQHAQPYGSAMSQSWSPSQFPPLPKRFLQLCERFRIAVVPESWFSVCGATDALFRTLLKEEFNLGQMCHRVQLHETPLNGYFAHILCVNAHGKLSLSGDHHEKQAFFRAMFHLPSLSPTEWTRRYQQWESDVATLVKVLNLITGSCMGASLRKMAAPVDKVLLLHPMLRELDRQDLTNAISFEVLLLVLFIATDFMRRKEFTLESQIQGALNPELQSLYEMIMTHVNLSQVDKLLIASILPTRDIIGTLLPHNVSTLANMVSNHVREFAYFMDAQYTIGAKQALGRGGSVHARCHAERTGCKVNSTAWNGIAGALSNLARVYTLLTEKYAQQFDFFLPIRIPRLVANDQFQWADMMGREDDSMNDFSTLFRDESEVDLFASLLCRCSAPEHLERFKHHLREASVPEARWIPKCQRSVQDFGPRRQGVRTQSNTFAQPDLVCGIAVHPMAVDTLKAQGCFGATPNTGS